MNLVCSFARKNPAGQEVAPLSHIALGRATAVVMAVLISGSFAAVAVAQAATPAAPPQHSFGAVLTQMMPMFAMVFFVFYFMVLRPQQLKEKAQDDLLKGLKKGEGVVTSAGIFGKVAGVEEAAILLEVAPNVRVRVEKTSIVRRETAA
jgi:preprotein translocase subunit YajC